MSNFSDLSNMMADVQASAREKKEEAQAKLDEKFGARSEIEKAFGESLVGESGRDLLKNVMSRTEAGQKVSAAAKDALAKYRRPRRQ